MTHKQKQTTPESYESKNDKELRLKGRAPEGKKVKKEISHLWKSVQRKLEQGEAPTAAEEKSLVSAFADYTVFSEPVWQEEWLACFMILRQALDCARRGEMLKAGEYAEEVNRLTKACHKKYK